MRPRPARRPCRLPHRLDDALGGDRLRQLAHLDLERRTDARRRAALVRRAAAASARPAATAMPRRRRPPERSRVRNDTAITSLAGIDAERQVCRAPTREARAQQHDADQAPPTAVAFEPEDQASSASPTTMRTPRSIPPTFLHCNPPLWTTKSLAEKISPAPENICDLRHNRTGLRAVPPAQRKRRTRPELDLRSSGHRMQWRGARPGHDHAALRRPGAGHRSGARAGSCPTPQTAGRRRTPARTSPWKGR